jgi:AP-1 complex subunit mu
VSLVVRTLTARRYITQESHKLEAQVRPPMAVTNAVSWRLEGIWYRKNEVFLDVVESVNLLVNASGNVVRSEILGAVKIKCYLSGMPELRLGLNDKVMFESTGRSTSLPSHMSWYDAYARAASRGKAIEMEDVKFHQCVRLARFESDRTISFIPPDGEFELMSYWISTPVKPLVWVEAAVEVHRGSRVEYLVKVKGQFKRRSTANNVEIFVPVPDDADSSKVWARLRRSPASCLGVHPRRMVAALHRPEGPARGRHEVHDARAPSRPRATSRASRTE